MRRYEVEKLPESLIIFDEPLKDMLMVLRGQVTRLEVLADLVRHVGLHSLLLTLQDLVHAALEAVY